LLSVADSELGESSLSAAEIPHFRVAPVRSIPKVPQIGRLTDGPWVRALLQGGAVPGLEEAMATVKVSSFVAAPVDEVFQLFTDIEHGAAHVSGIKTIDMLTVGPARLGTRWRETREIMGVTDSAEMEITSFERNRTYTITHRKAGVPIATTFAFEPASGGTNVSVEFEFEPGGMPPGFLAPLGWVIEGKVRQVLGRDLADLKQAIER
jgi:uncharacterized protein YndB with AHSA1/START domain